MKKNRFRTHNCGELRKDHIGEEVTLSGWVENIRDHGGVLFLDLRDQYGTVQTVSNDDDMFKNIPRESVITVKGKVRERDEETINKRIVTGEIEVLVDSLDIQSKAKNELPFEVMSSRSSNEEIRLKHRYLDLRNEKVKNNILFRSEVIKYMRTLMEEKGFTEFQTPILTASSPEGAREFIVPSRKFHGNFYVLPQAPQIFKQLLMVSGFDKYYQIAPCFRDEDARSDRLYGEFYQLDMEMAFADEEDVLELGEDVFYDIFTKFGNKKVSPKPFRRIPFKEAMEKYGTDKPDLRNPLELVDLTYEFRDTTFKPFSGVTVKGITVHGIGDKSNSWFNELVDYAKTIDMPGIGYITLLEDGTFKGPIDKFLSDNERDELIKKCELKTNSVLFFIADRNHKKACKQAGLIRDELGRKLDIIDKDKFEFCIVNDFPMYEWSEEEERFDFTHNPFSMPQGGMEGLDNENKEDILAYQYDFVCNGIELASGAVRNHDLDIMRKAFAIAGYSEEVIKDKFKSLYTAFQYGAPPHAGMAPGIDRILMMLKDEDRIREFVAFPMTSGGQDLMMGSPNEVTEMQLREAHIKIR